MTAIESDKSKAQLKVFIVSAANVAQSASPQYPLDAA
jgi:hypothetical protein